MKTAAYFVILACFFAVLVAGIRIGAGDNAPIMLGEVAVVVALAMINVDRLRRLKP